MIEACGRWEVGEANTWRGARGRYITSMEGNFFRYYQGVELGLGLGTLRGRITFCIHRTVLHLLGASIYPFIEFVDIEQTLL